MKIEAGPLQSFFTFLGVLAQYKLHVLYGLVTFLFYDQCTFFQREIRNWVCAPNITSLGKVTGYVLESIEWFIEGQAFLRTYYMAQRPPPSPPFPSASCLSFSIFLCIAGPAYWRERGSGWAWSRIILPQESLALYTSFNTLWYDYISSPSLFIRRLRSGRLIICLNSLVAEDYALFVEYKWSQNRLGWIFL